MTQEHNRNHPAVHKKKHQAWRNQSPPPNIDYIKKTLGLDPKSEDDKTFIEQLEKYTQSSEADKKDLLDELRERFDQKAIEEIIENEADPLKKQTLKESFKKLLEQTRIANKYNQQVKNDITEIKGNEEWRPTEDKVLEFERKIDLRLINVSKKLKKYGVELELEARPEKIRGGRKITKDEYIKERRDELSVTFKDIKTKIHDFFFQKMETIYKTIFKTGDHQAAKEKFMSEAFEAPKPGKGCDTKSPPLFTECSSHELTALSRS